MSELKLCIDCNYLRGRKCHHPVTGVDLVEGGIRTELAAVMRLDSQPCKPEALLFQPQEAVIYDLRDLFPDVNFPNIRGQNQ